MMLIKAGVVSGDLQLFSVVSLSNLKALRGTAAEK